MFETELDPLELVEGDPYLGVVGWLSSGVITAATPPDPSISVGKK
jgi:hypothetical protein